MAKISFYPSSHNRGSRKTQSNLLQKKKEIREKIEKKQKRVAAKFRWTTAGIHVQTRPVQGLIG